MGPAPGVRIHEPSILGSTLAPAPIVDHVFAQRARMNRCRGERPLEANVHLHVHPPGRITLAGQNPNVTSDAEASRCVANVLRGAGAIDGLSSGSGIVTVRVSLAPE